MRTFDEIREEVFAKYPICKDAGKWLIPGAVIAKVRLINVIEEDRAAVPCGRWVKVVRLPKTQGGMMMRMVDEAMWRRASTFMDSITKPRYRWSERR